jgi:hypothetical protein
MDLNYESEMAIITAENTIELYGYNLGTDIPENNLLKKLRKSMIRSLISLAISDITLIRARCLFSDLYTEKEYPSIGMVLQMYSILNE